MFFPLFLGLLAEARWCSESYREALALLDQALAVGDSTGEHSYDSELHRLRAEVIGSLFPERIAEVETALEQAVAVAQAQGARLLEQRAWDSLQRSQASNGATSSKGLPPA